MVQDESSSLAMPPKALSWVWCTIRRVPVEGLVAAEERPLCERAQKWSADFLLAALGSASFQHSVCVNQAGVGETAALSCHPSPSLLLRCNFFNEENLLSKNITFLKACPDKAVQADNFSKYQSLITEILLPPHPPATPLVPRQGNESHSCS